MQVYCCNGIGTQSADVRTQSDRILDYFSSNDIRLVVGVLQLFQHANSGNDII